MILRKHSARGRAGLFICIGRTINIDWSMTPGYLKSTKVRSHSKHVEIQIEHYKHTGSTPVASTTFNSARQIPLHSCSESYVMKPCPRES